MQQQLAQMQQQQQQQQQQPMIAAGFNAATITTDHIQRYLDENKSLIMKILDNQSSGKFAECAENQAKLQQNLMYLAAIADCQPQPASSMFAQTGANYMMQQQMQSPQQQMMQQPPLMLARSPALHSQHQHQHQQQYPGLHHHLGASYGGGTTSHALQRATNEGEGFHGASSRLPGGHPRGDNIGWTSSSAGSAEELGDHKQASDKVPGGLSLKNAERD